MKKTIGLCAPVLVDVDLLSPLLQQLLVERTSFDFVANVEYERLSPFCFFL